MNRMTKITRRDALTRGGAAVALGGTIAVAGTVGTAVAAVGTQAPDALQAGVQAVIADIRSLPGSTVNCVYEALQKVADRLDRLATGLSIPVAADELDGTSALTPQQQIAAWQQEMLGLADKILALRQSLSAGAITTQAAAGD